MGQTDAAHGPEQKSMEMVQQFIDPWEVGLHTISSKTHQPSFWPEAADHLRLGKRNIGLWTQCG